MVQQILHSLKKRGYRRTKQREIIAGVLSRYDKPMSAREVYESIGQAHPSISLDTVYRTLELFREADIVVQINLQNRESARFELVSDGEHHHHLICSQCGIFLCLPVCPVNERHLQIAREMDFSVEGHAFELYGRCGPCQQQSTD